MAVLFIKEKLNQNILQRHKAQEVSTFVFLLGQIQSSMKRRANVIFQTHCKH